MGATARFAAVAFRFPAPPGQRCRPGRIDRRGGQQEGQRDRGRDAPSDQAAGDGDRRALAAREPDGGHTGDGNARFDASLRAEDPAWGIRDLEGELVPAAEAAGLRLDALQPMPSNNLTVVFRRG